MKEEDNELNTRGQRPANEEPDVTRKPYLRPRLTLYGDVDVITQGANMGNQDGDQTGNSLTGTV